MDGVMFMHSSRLPLLREALEGAQGIGPLHRIATQFSFMSNEEFRKSNIRSNSNYEPHGALGDLGWYNLRLILWANNWRMPTEIRAKCLSTIQGQDSPKPVPAEFSAELFFEGGPSASMFCSFLAEHQQWAHFSGARGSVWVEDFVLPFYGSEVGFDVVRPEFRVEGCDFHMHRRSRRVGVPEYAAGFAGAQEVAMFETFQQAARSKEPDERWGQMTLATQRLLDAVFLAAGCQL
jgi:predicted dehydrogenase